LPQERTGEKEMKKEEILNYLKKELDTDKDYNFVVVDLRKKPLIFKAWWIEKDNIYGVREE